ncbi:MAG: DUF3467 domain-containing protein [Bacteroidia bacterium]|nr:DUF3467 domain-containing protein [Bacteroidia bacterium]
MANNNPNPPFQIELPEEVASGVYCNVAAIAHSHAEFILDFIQMLPGPGPVKPTVKSRIIMAPVHAKQVLMALKDNIEKFEKIHGEIEMPDDKNNIPPMFGGGPAGVA